MKKAIVIITLIFSLVLPVTLTAQSENTDSLLKSLGASLAGALYFSYMSIMSISDGYEKMVYTASEVIQLMDANNSLIDNMVQNLSDSLEKYEYEESDAGFIQDSITVLGELRDLADMLVKYTKDKGKKTTIEFAKIKTKAKADIKTLLGME